MTERKRHHAHAQPAPRARRKAIVEPVQDPRPAAPITAEMADAFEYAPTEPHFNVAVDPSNGPDQTAVVHAEQTEDGIKSGPAFDPAEAAREFAEMLDQSPELDKPKKLDRFWYALLALILFGLAFLIANGAFAHPLNPDECRGFALDIQRAAEHRDRGMSWEAAQRNLIPGLANAIVMVGPHYVHDQADVDMATQAFAEVWKATDEHDQRLTPGQLYDKTKDLCGRTYYRAGGS